MPAAKGSERTPLGPKTKPICYTVQLGVLTRYYSLALFFNPPSLYIDIIYKSKQLQAFVGELIVLPFITKTCGPVTLGEQAVERNKRTMK